MIIGVGTDLLAVSRIPDLPPEDPFFRKAFTERERQEAAESDDPLRRFASDFSGKEAVFKALRAHPDAFRLNEIEILRGAYGAPFVTLYGRAAAHAERLGVRQIHLSLSWETEYCLAFAVAVTDPPKE